jgi:DNA-binding transcriptional LysR family regulator
MRECLFCNNDARRTNPPVTMQRASSALDLVAGEYDAGIQIGEFIQRDMIAVRVSKDMRVALVGSPAYFKSHKIPRAPRDLKDTPASRSAKGARCRRSIRRGR